jgi:hypothetical protein
MGSAGRTSDSDEATPGPTPERQYTLAAYGLPDFGALEAGGPDDTPVN